MWINGRLREREKKINDIDFHYVGFMSDFIKAYIKAYTYKRQCNKSINTNSSIIKVKRPFLLVTKMTRTKQKN